MKTLTKNKNDNLPLVKVILLIFIPSILLTASYILLGQIQKTIPSLLLFIVLAMLILFPVELAIVLNASKKEFGKYSVRSAFANHEKMSWKKIFIYGILLFGFAGIASVTVGPFETWITAPISNKLTEIIPTYFDWNNIEYIRQYPKNLLILTCVLFAIFNIFIGPIVEELFFRGYLTSKISRFGKWSPAIITILFSLYHLWLPLQNIFRICIILPMSYVTWKEKNIYISMVSHCLCNLVSTVSFFVTIFAVK